MKGSIVLHKCRPLFLYMLVFYIVLQGIGGPNVRKRMGKIKDLPNHVSVLLLVEKWDKKMETR